MSVRPGRRGAPATLAALLAPRAKRDFMARAWQREFALIRGARGRFEPLLPWAALNRILNEHALAAPRLRAFRAGRQVAGGAHEPGLLAAAPLARELRSGATLILDRIEELHPPLRRLAENLERELGAGVQVNAYAGWRATRGFDLHWDDHDVMILQVHGSKQWKVYGATRAHPVSGETVARPRGRAAWAGTLRPGDLLYMPRGVWHVAVPQGEPTLHLTVGFATQTGLDCLEWWLERARKLEIARRDLPRLAPEPERQRYAEELFRSVARSWKPRVLEDFLEQRDSARPARVSHALPYTALATPLKAAGDAVTLRWVAPRKPRWKRSDDGLRLHALGQEWHFDAAAEPLLRRLEDAEPHSVAEVLRARPRGVSAADALALLNDLVHRGLLAIEA